MPSPNIYPCTKETTLPKKRHFPSGYLSKRFNLIKMLHFHCSNTVAPLQENEKKNYPHYFSNF